MSMETGGRDAFDLYELPQYPAANPDTALKDGDTPRGTADIGYGPYACADETGAGHEGGDSAVGDIQHYAPGNTATYKHPEQPVGDSTGGGKPPIDLPPETPTPGGAEFGEEEGDGGNSGDPFTDQPHKTEKTLTPDDINRIREILDGLPPPSADGSTESSGFNKNHDELRNIGSLGVEITPVTYNLDPIQYDLETRPPTVGPDGKPVFEAVALPPITDLGKVIDNLGASHVNPGTDPALDLGNTAGVATPPVNMFVSPGGTASTLDRAVKASLDAPRPDYPTPSDVAKTTIAKLSSLVDSLSLSDETRAMLEHHLEESLGQASGEQPGEIDDEDVGH